MNSDKKVRIIVIAPFWGERDHVGRYRVERFVHWLSLENYHVTIIWSGWEDKIVKECKWDELEIRDPLRRFTKNANKPDNNRSKEGLSKRSFSPRKIIQSIVYYFDRELVWSLMITRKAIVKDVCKDARVVISSSPPESIHLTSYLISRKFKLRMVIDLRDGWLDEPLRNLNTKWSFKRLIEKKIESRIIKYAAKIFVTSNKWKEMIVKRLPISETKMTVLTNAYPNSQTVDFDIPKKAFASALTLLHCGRFIGSRSTNKMSILLSPLSALAEIDSNIKAEIVLLGNLINQDLEELINWENRFKNTRLTLTQRNTVSREEMFTELNKATGLLLLAASMGSIPSKTFEYIISGKPILAVTLKDSAVWQMVENIPQMFLYDYTAQKPDYTPVEEFLKACQTGEYEYNIPKEYSEEYLSKIFLDTIKNV